MASEVREDIAYLSDIKDDGIIPSGAVQGNIPVFGSDGKLADSSKKPSDFYDKAEIDSKLEEIGATDEEIVEAIHNEYAIDAYMSDDWVPSKSYHEGDFCQYGDPKRGYRCIEDHISSAVFATTKWKLVLSNAGKLAIDDLLSECGKNKAPLLSLADAYTDKNYTKGDLAIKDGLLQIATKTAYGDGANFSTNITIDQVIKDRIAAHADNTTIHVTQSEKNEWNGKQSAISDIGEIRQNAAKGAQAAERDKIVIAANGSVTASHPDGSDPVVLATGTSPATKLSYRVVAAERGTESDDVIPFTLIDRAINVIDSVAAIPDGKSFSLIPPSPPQGSTSEDVLARDFLVSIHANSEHDIVVTASTMSLEDYAGGEVSLVVPAGEWVLYRFTEIAKSGMRFVVTGAADPSWTTLHDCERALDALLSGEDLDDYVCGIEEIEAALDKALESGGVIDFPVGAYIPGSDGLLHKIMAVEDPETGEFNVGVDDQGVEG